ncbi:MAG: hypothetical protein DSZ28_01980 [Thiothrix sp.]|nr:MAG: hypothetical protein DSZ28_01980 [Thiothrix sp.]
MKIISVSALLIVATMLSGCSDSSSSKTPPPPTTTDSDSGDALNEDLKKRSFNVSQAESDGFIDVKIGPNDISMHITFVMKDISKTIMVTEIKDPKGTIIYKADADLDTGEINSIVSGFADTLLGDPGSMAVFLPPNPHLELMEGSYRFSIVREDNSPLKSVNALIKSIPSGQAVDQQTYKADLNIWITHPEPEFNNDAFKQLVKTEYKDSINRILAPHSLSIDTINFYTATDAEKVKFADINVEKDRAEACLAMLPVTKNKLAFNLVYARELTSSEGEGPAGVSPAPGTLLDDTASNSCFFVNQRAYVADPAIGFTQDLVNQMMAGNILHESAHFMSLEHPTEENGDDFDFFPDTAQCDAATFDGRDNAQFGVPGEKDGIMSDFECGIDGGANNFLFYGGIPNFLPFEMSPDQAKTLRRHPLFTRVK